VPRLILLNGPPGIGKSTLAQLYADDHPGMLNLDIDLLRALIGGWRDRFAETGAIVRPLAVGMAGAHLAGGRDVIMPQFLGRLTEVERFEAVAHGNGAAFCEIALMDSKRQSVARFYSRGGEGGPGWHQYARQVVEVGGGPALLARHYDQLADVLAARPGAVVLRSAEGKIQETYEALAAILGDGT
jgi:predicted kinase